MGEVTSLLIQNEPTREVETEWFPPLLRRNRLVLFTIDSLLLTFLPFFINARSLLVVGETDLGILLCVGVEPFYEVLVGPLPFASSQFAAWYISFPTLAVALQQ